MNNHETLFDTLLATTAEPVFVIDSDCRIVRASRALEASLGIAAIDLLGLPVERLGELMDEPQLAVRIRAAFSSCERHSETIALAGHAHSWEFTVEPIRDADGASGCVAFLRPADSAGNSGREGFDAQSGLPNRNLFLDRVGQAINNAQRGGKSVIVILTLVDRLREIHDLLGGAAGRQLLQDIVERLRQCVRTSDTVARLEEDRFAFVMQISAIDDSVMLTEKVLAAFEQPFRLDNQNDVVINCALGASLHPADGETPDDLVKNAAIALHHAKQAGNRCQFFSGEMNARARRRLEVESGIRRALGNGEFLVYYQPKIDIGSGRVAGMEALVRWLDPERGMVSPGEFIPVAEESGLIEQIGQWVMEETCAQNVRWQQQGLPAVCASVNVSARQFRNRNFVASVEQVLERTGLDPQWLELEITESMLMGDIEAIVARMEALRGLGVSLSIDDFGTGYSSLSYLSRFPINTLKIDRAFINDVQTNPHTAEIARAIIGLSRGLNLEVVAEGAEVREQVDFLQQHGCDLVQGFFYSRPLPAEEFAVMLKNGMRA